MAELLALAIPLEHTSSVSRTKTKTARIVGGSDR